jgi:hypothetical protein
MNVRGRKEKKGVRMKSHGNEKRVKFIKKKHEKKR